MEQSMKQQLTPETPVNFQQTLNNLLTPAIEISDCSCFMPTELIIRTFSYISFYERTNASLTCKAFYAAYRSCCANRPLLKLILAGDYISFIPAFCRETPARQNAIINSYTFAVLMIYAGLPMTAIYRVLSTDRPIPSCLCSALIKKYGSFMGFIPGKPIGTGYVYELIQYHYFTEAEQVIRAAGWFDEPDDINDDINDDIYEDLRCDIEWALTCFHGRCVSTSDTCMVHHTHKHLTSVIPQFVIDLHSRINITPYQLYHYIHAARKARNHDDDLWLQKRYPDLYLEALFHQPDNDDEPRIDCNIKNIVDFGDDVAALKSMDKRRASYRL
jgi:hypothetical protein